jgi:hypothetical protein
MRQFSTVNSIEPSFLFLGIFTYWAMKNVELRSSGGGETVSVADGPVLIWSIGTCVLIYRSIILNSTGWGPLYYAIVSVREGSRPAGFTKLSLVVI